MRRGSPAAGRQATTRRRCSPTETQSRLRRCGAAKAERDALTGKMRETTLRLANDTVVAHSGTRRQSARPVPVESERAAAKGQFDTEASIQARLADQRPGAQRRPGDGCARHRAVARRQDGGAGAGMARARRAATRRTRNGPPNAAASTEMPAIVRQRQGWIEMAERELKQLQDQGADPLTIKGVQDKIAGIMRTPGMRASSVVQKAMDSVTNACRASQADGTVNAHDLYMIRKRNSATRSMWR